MLLESSISTAAEDGNFAVASGKGYAQMGRINISPETLYQSLGGACTSEVFGVVRAIIDGKTHQKVSNSSPLSPQQSKQAAQVIAILDEVVWKERLRA
jgi:hypothetical protein